MSNFEITFNTVNYNSRRSFDIEILKNYFGRDITLNYKQFKNKAVINFEVEYEYQKLELENLLHEHIDVKLVTTNKNITIIQAFGVVKHYKYDIWYTKINTNIDDVLNKIQILDDKNIFTIRKPKQMPFFIEFYQSFGYNLFVDNDEFISLVSTNPHFDSEWLINTIHYTGLSQDKIYNNTIPFAYVYINDDSSKSKIYASFIWAYIQGVQGTFLANYYFYLSLNIININGKTVAKFQIPNIEIFNRIMSFYVNPDNFSERTFLTRNEALLFRENLSKNDIRSIIYKNSTVLWLSNEKELTKFDSNLRENILNKIVSKQDDITFEDFESLELSELFEVVVFNNNACKSSTLKKMKINPFTNVLFKISERDKFDNNYKGFETINGLLGIVDNIEIMHEFKIDDGCIVPIAKRDFNNEYNIYDFTLGYSDGTLGSNIISLILKELDLDKTVKILQKSWKNGTFLNLWDAAYYMSNNILSYTSDIINYESETIRDSENFILQLGY